MNKKIIAFGASNSKNSINKLWAKYVCTFFSDFEIEVLDLNDYPTPLYSIDLESEKGIPENVNRFLSKIDSADFIVISLAENNGSYNAYFKNLFDWVSRSRQRMFENKKLLLLSTAPGARGGESVMNAALDRFPRHGAEILGSFLLPFFQKNYDIENGLKDSSLKLQLEELIAQVKLKI